jgi:hypothetical protein
MTNPQRMKRLFSWFGDGYAFLFDTASGVLRKVDYRHPRGFRRGHHTKRAVLRAFRRGALVR